MGQNIYKYYILKDKNLVVEILRGSFDITDFIRFKKSESEDPDFDPNFDSILDIRNIENPFSKEVREGLGNYVKIIKTFQPVTRPKRTAVITQRPSQVAGITWYQLINNRSIDYKVFSTLDAAIKWLGISAMDLDHIDFTSTDH